MRLKGVERRPKVKTLAATQDDRNNFKITVITICLRT